MKVSYCTVLFALFRGVLTVSLRTWRFHFAFARSRFARFAVWAEEPGW